MLTYQTWEIPMWRIKYTKTMLISGTQNDWIVCPLSCISLIFCFLMQGFLPRFFWIIIASKTLFCFRRKTRLSELWTLSCRPLHIFFLNKRVSSRVCLDYHCLKLCFRRLWELWTLWYSLYALYVQSRVKWLWIL